MRITSSMMANETLLNLNNQQGQIGTLSQEISSGQQLLSPSDDPVSWSQAMSANQTVREYNSFVSNVNFATGWGQATESALNQLSDLLSQAQQVAETASSSTDNSQSGALTSEVNTILQQAETVANTQYEGQYIFSGTATDTEPYSIDSSTGDVTYSGNSDSIEVQTSTSSGSQGGLTAVNMNMNGNDILGAEGGGVNVLNAIWSLGQAIQSGNSTDVSSSLTTIGDAFNQVNDQLATVGTMVSGLTNQQSALSTMVTNEKGVLSNLDDTDMTSAVTKLSQAQTTYQAALQVTSLLDSLNLASILSSGS